MAFSRGQTATAWTCFAVMGGMLLYPPWFWASDSGVLSSAQFGAGYDWVWSPPPSPGEQDWQPVIWWRRLLGQWFLVAVGMLLLLFLREARERSSPVDTDPPSPSNKTQQPTGAPSGAGG